MRRGAFRLTLVVGVALTPAASAMAQYKLANLDSNQVSNQVGWAGPLIPILSS